MVLVLALVGLAPATAPGAADRPQLRIERWRPTTVAGFGFHAREGVRLTLHYRGGVRTRRTRAHANGKFSAAFADVAIDRCTRYSVTATGSAGSHARLARRQLPECAPR